MVVLVLLWSGVLLPGVIRDRRASPASTVDGFSNAMTRLAGCDSRRVFIPGTGPRMAVYPRPSRRAALLERRRSVLLRLIASIGVAASFGLVFGGITWWLTGLAVMTVVGYMVALRLMAIQAQQARTVVQMHPVRASAAQATHPMQGVSPEAREAAAAPVASGHDRTAEPLFG